MRSTNIFWQGRPVAFVSGDTIAIALMRAGICQFGVRQTHLDAAVLCGIGQCQNCLVNIEGRGIAEACLTPCESGLFLSPINEIHHDKARG
jgi:predicted molibdopterin-dependent oxidoreductase YjgC